MHDERKAPIPFESPLTPLEVEAHKLEREDRLAERNKMDAQAAKAAERGRIERAFNARPVGPTTAGKL